MTATLRPAFDYSRLPSERGRTRIVHIDAEWVYKVPTSDEGAIANWREARLWEHNASRPDDVYVRIAECYMLADGALMMRRVEPCFDSYDEMPDWVGAVDCAQVGYVDGELVAYDL